MLELKGIAAGYGSITVIQDISFTMSDGEIYAILGANGSGKTTLISAIMGFIRCKSGSIKFANREITILPTQERAKLGMSIVPEGRRLFSELSVIENLRLGGYIVKDDKFKERLDFVDKLFPILKEFRNSPSSRLSGGQQQMLAVARALISSPSLIILDEPSTGLMPQAVAQVYSTIKSLKESGVSVLLVEQNIRKAISVADRVALLQTGRLILESKPSELVENEIVKKAYLG